MRMRWSSICIGNFSESVGAASSFSVRGEEMLTKLSSESDSSSLSSLEGELHGGRKMDTQSSGVERPSNNVSVTF